MSELSGELYKRCRDTLMQCSQFNDDASLRAIFVTAELHPFRDGLPEAANPSDRVDQCLAYLVRKRTSDGRPVLPLFLAALHDRYQPGDALRDELARLAVEVEAAGLSAPSFLPGVLCQAPPLPPHFVPRPEVTETLKAHLLAAEQPQMLTEALAATRAIRDERSRAEALAGLAAHLPADLLTEALAAARAIGDEWYRAQALAGLAPRLAKLPTAILLPLWRETLPPLAGHTRQALLADLAALAPVIAVLGGAEAVAETSRAIRDMGRWWP